LPFVRLARTAPLLAAFALAGCQVRLPIEDARAESVELAQVQNDAPAGTPMGAKGPWTEVNLSVSRASLTKIALWQLYSTVRVLDCRSGKLSDIARTKVNGVRTTDFRQLRQVLRQTPGLQHYWLVGYVLHAPPGSCAKLDGGSRLGQTISSDGVPIKFE
jgi:hypothetical protein